MGNEIDMEIMELDLAGSGEVPEKQPDLEVAEEKVEEKVDEVPKEETPGEGDGVEKAEKIEEPEKEVPLDQKLVEGEKVEEPEKKEEVDPRDKVIDDLRNDLKTYGSIIEELSNKLGIDVRTGAVKEKEPEKKEEQKPEEKKEEVKPKLDMVPGRFVDTDEAIDEALKDVDSFNGLMQKVAAYAVEQVLSSVPKLVVQLTDQQIVFRQAAKEFWDNNKDLVDKKSFVTFVTNDLAQHHPEWSLDQLFTESEKEVRKRLNLPRPVIDATRTPDSGKEDVRAEKEDPAFLNARGVRPGRERRPVDTTTQEIEELIKDL